jgi:type II secretory pathway pseudopilin PulG
MEYERQQREYRLQMERQQQEQQRQQQLMNENARRQQEESRRLNTNPGSGAGSQSGMPGYATPTPGRSSGASDNLAAARIAWQKKPALPPEQNPLLAGKWTRPASTQSKSSDPFAALAAMAKGGLCDVLFGGGTFEFRTDRLMGMDARTPPQQLDLVEYRGDSKHVVVIPKTTVKLMEFDVEGPNRINWKSQKCVLVRAGR